MALIEADASLAEQGGWPYHGKGAACVNGYFNDRARDVTYWFPPDFLCSLVPLARDSYLLAKLAARSKSTTSTTPTTIASRCASTTAPATTRAGLRRWRPPNGVGQSRVP